MRRLRRPMSIKSNLLLFFFVFFCIPFLAFCLVWYAKSAETIEESGIYYNEQLIGRANAQLDDYFAAIKADTMAIPGHPLVQEFIKLDPANAYDMYRLKARLSNELVPNLRNDMYAFSIVSAKGAYFGDFLTHPWASGPYDMPLLDESFRILGITEKDGVAVLTVYRKIVDNVTYEPAGAVVMGLSLQPMMKIADIKPYGKTGTIAITDEDGQILYHTDRGKWGTFLPADWTSEMSGDGGRLVRDGPEGRKMMVYQSSKLTRFRVLSEMSMHELLGGLPRLQLQTLLVGALILVLAFLVFYRMFREVKKLLVENHTARMREKELELKHREALLSAQQSRINPHFLYNALEIINSYAVLARVKPISRMTVHLSNLFRYSVSNPSQVVTLREELDHIWSYIRIQEQRFEELKFEVDVDESMLDGVYLFRLTVQPLVENAFRHAYEKHGLTPGKILISGVAEESLFSLYVRDEGRGMAPELADKYNEAFETVTEGKMLRPGFSPFRAIGLWNVHTRLRLAFGAPYGIKIASSGERGTVFQMKLPYLKGVVNDVQSADCG
ncbi:sensor histidine kinase [Paenibacillus flagellatus]|uniref:sensor histidine kinase n=1 Tax=Paenibacillus flagellatus TaxID=2211139 RepID=UPI0013052CAA|nr:histidine kinase [Paenibacillus flagellatus]